MKKTLSILLIAVSLITSCGKKNEPNPNNVNSTVTVSTFAGSGFNSSTNGTGTLASFENLSGIVCDGSGNVFVSQTYGLIRKITPSGVVSTFATLPGSDGLAIDASGNLFVSDFQNYLIRKVTPAGVVSTFATGIPRVPLAVDASGNVCYVSLYLYKISPTGTRLPAIGNGYDINFAQIAFDSQGNLYLPDLRINIINEINTTGQVSIFAGSEIGNNVNNPVSTNGPKSEATFANPTGIAIDKSGNIYISDTFTNLIRKISTNGTVSTLAGNGLQGSVNGKSSIASFNQPNFMTIDQSGNLYIIDGGMSYPGNGNLIRKIMIN